MVINMMKRKVSASSIFVIAIFILAACSRKDTGVQVDKSDTEVQENSIEETKQTIAEEPTAEKNATEKTITEETASGESTIKDSMMQETTLYGDTPEETTLKESLSEESTSETTTIKQTMIEESTVQESTLKDFETEQSTIEKPIIGPTEEITTDKDIEMSDDKEMDIQRVDVKWNQGFIDKSGDLVVNNKDYVYSDLIQLSENDVLKYRATGSSSVSLLALYSSEGEFERIIENGGKWHVIDRYYHAEKLCYVRICKRKTDNTNPNCFEVGEYETYILDKNKLKRNLLYGKSMLVIGDSLIYGNKIGNDVVWVNQLGMKYNMDTFNYGINGNTVSNVDRKNGIPMSERYISISEDVQAADIIIVEGGANDKNNNCTIGENSDNTNETFKGALNVLIDGLREKYPDKVILFMTCFERYGTKNKLGLRETDYAMAMLEICNLKGIPCFNNIEDSGISLLDDTVSEWADEGVYLENTDKKNKHFSPEAYAHLSVKYEEWIEQYLK